GSTGISWYNDAIYWNGSAGTSCSVEMGRVVSAGVAPAKLGVGTPFYGYKWSGCTRPLVSCTETSYFAYQDIANDTTRWQPRNQAYDSAYKSNYLSVAATNEFIPYNGVEFMSDVVAW